MRVIIVSESPKSIAGEGYVSGVGILVALQEKCLKENGHEVLVIQPDQRIVDSSAILLPSLRIPGSGYFTTLHRRYRPRFYRRLRKRIVEFGPDVVYCNGPYRSAIEITDITKPLGVPSVLHVHTDLSAYVYATIPDWYGPVVKRLAEILQMDRATALSNEAKLTVFPSNHYRQKFIHETGINGETVVFPGCVHPIPLMNEQERQEFTRGFLASEPMIGCKSTQFVTFASRLNREKNAEFALLAFAELSRIVSKLGMDSPAMVFVGKGRPEYQSYLEALAEELGIQGNVFFAGKQSNRNLRRILEISRMLLFPSNTDTQGLVVAEAGLAKCPTLVMAGEAPTESVKDDFLCIEPDPKEWAVAMYLLLADQHRYLEKAEHCYQMALSYCDPEAYYRQFTAILENALRT